MMISGQQQKMKRKDKIMQSKTAKKPKNADIINQTVSSRGDFSHGEINYDDLVEDSFISNSMEQDYGDDFDITQQLRDQISELQGQIALKNQQNKELRQRVEDWQDKYNKVFQSKAEIHELYLQEKQLLLEQKMKLQTQQPAPVQETSAETSQQIQDLKYQLKQKDSMIEAVQSQLSELKFKKSQEF